MEKHQIILERVRELTYHLHALGVAHITIYLTGSADLFSPDLPIFRVPFMQGEIIAQDTELDNCLVPTILIIKTNNTIDLSLQNTPSL